MTTANENQHDCFDTLHCAFDALHKRIAGTHYRSPELENYLHTGGISYGTVWQHSFELITSKGNVAKQGFHVTVERTEQGLYILNSYIL